MQQPGTYCKWHHLLLTWQFLLRGRGRGDGWEQGPRHLLPARAAGKPALSCGGTAANLTAGWGSGSSQGSSSTARPLQRPPEPRVPQSPPGCPRQAQAAQPRGAAQPPAPAGLGGHCPIAARRQGCSGRGAAGLPRAPSAPTGLGARLCPARAGRRWASREHTEATGLRGEPRVYFGMQKLTERPVYVAMETPLCCWISSETRSKLAEGASS